MWVIYISISHTHIQDITFTHVDIIISSIANLQVMFKT